jgi:hypothetical protein
MAHAPDVLLESGPARRMRELKCGYHGPPVRAAAGGAWPAPLPFEAYTVWADLNPVATHAQKRRTGQQSAIGALLIPWPVAPHMPYVDRPAAATGVGPMHTKGSWGGIILDVTHPAGNTRPVPFDFGRFSTYQRNIRQEAIPVHSVSFKNLHQEQIIAAVGMTPMKQQERESHEVLREYMDAVGTLWAICGGPSAALGAAAGAAAHAASLVASAAAGVLGHAALAAAAAASATAAATAAPAPLAGFTVGARNTLQALLDTSVREYVRAYMLNRPKALEDVHPCACNNTECIATFDAMRVPAIAGGVYNDDVGEIADNVVDGSGGAPVLCSCNANALGAAHVAGLAAATAGVGAAAALAAGRLATRPGMCDCSLTAIVRDLKL